MNIEHNNPSNEAEALADLSGRYPFATVLDIEPVDNAPHWHNFDAESHILSGDLTLTDADGHTHTCAAGTTVSVPQRTVHAEFSRAGYRIVLGTSTTPEHFGEPVNRPLSEL